MGLDCTPYVLQYFKNKREGPLGSLRVPDISPPHAKQQIARLHVNAGCPERSTRFDRSATNPPLPSDRSCRRQNKLDTLLGYSQFDFTSSVVYHFLSASSYE